MSIHKKLFEAKKEIGKISKDSKNPFYKSKYFDINQLLEHVEPLVTKNDLLILQPIINNKVVTQIIDVEDGSMVFSEMELTNITDPQKRGSEITYYRRYTLSSLLGLQAEDDDANKTVKKPNEELKWLNLDSEAFHGGIAKKTPIQTMLKYFRISKSVQDEYEKQLNKPLNHDKERQLTLINSIKTLEDLEFAELHVTDETLIPVLKAKKIQFNKKKQ